MKITKAELFTSAVSKKQYPNDQLPEIALAGRSNVGKSSFINRMMNRKNLVRTSSKPGKTRTLNFYLINEAFYFVDVPGYGYAKVSKQEQEAWGRMMEEYFETRKELKLVIQIVDSRHQPTAADLQMIEYITYLDRPLLIVATKIDKVKKSERKKKLAELRQILASYGDIPIVTFSAETGENKEQIWNIIEEYVL